MLILKTQFCTGTTLKGIPLRTHYLNVMCQGSSELSINQPYQPDLALLDIVYFQKLKTYLRRSRFNYRTEISHAIQKYNRPLNNAWFIHVYIELGEILSVLHIRVSTLRRSIVTCDNNYHDVSRRCYDVVVRRFCVHGVIKFFVKSLKRYSLYAGTWRLQDNC